MHFFAQFHNQLLYESKIWIRPFWVGLPLFDPDDTHLQFGLAESFFFTKEMNCV